MSYEVVASSCRGAAAGRSHICADAAVEVASRLVRRLRAVLTKLAAL